MGLKVLVISAHVDDAECGCGGTVARHIARGDTIEWHTLIGQGYRVPDGWDDDVLRDEFRQAMFELGVEDHYLYDYPVDVIDRESGVRDHLYKIWHSYKPDIAYVPWSASRHQDHRTVGQYAYEVSWGSLTDIRVYVVPNDYLGFVPTVSSLISDEYYDTKLRALSCYKSQYELRHWYNDELLDNFSKAFAVFASGTDEHVEPFQQLKRVLL